jgi:hypothetical protein
MTPEQIQALEQKSLEREARMDIAEVARHLPLIEGADCHLLPYILAHRDPDYDDLRIEGSTHLTLKEWVRQQLRGPWSFLTNAQASSKKAASPEDDFDLDSFVPGQATPEQRQKLRAALQRLGEREEAKRKALR